MNLPLPGDFIDIHTHDANPVRGYFKIETLMAHEGKNPLDIKGIAYTAGIHPWNLSEGNKNQQIEFVKSTAADISVLAVGEAGFDKLRGPSFELQREVFYEQIVIAERLKKPVIIHCVRAWDELLNAHKTLKPLKPWLIHGFRGKKELASQLISRGMYISLWFEFALRNESANLVKYLPKDRLFIETDGADLDIREIYGKIAADMGTTTEKLKTIISDNFLRFFNIQV